MAADILFLSQSLDMTHLAFGNKEWGVCVRELLKIADSSILPPSLPPSPLIILAQPVQIFAWHVSVFSCYSWKPFLTRLQGCLFGGEEIQWWWWWWW